eukprot:3171988-Amphidinium_carterae.1
MYSRIPCCLEVILLVYPHSLQPLPASASAGCPDPELPCCEVWQTTGTLACHSCCVHANRPGVGTRTPD